MNLQVKIGDQTFNVEVGDLSARPVLATIDGETFEVWPEEPAVKDTAVVTTVLPVVEKVAPLPAAPVQVAAPALRQASAPAPVGVSGTGSQAILAPIPGSIVSVLVKPGDSVTKGQELIGLEAMKMKNAIRATRDGTIAAVHVKVGDHVQKGHPLVEFSS